MSTTNITDFERFGRSFHLKIRSADDFERVLDLDETHWVATSAPVSSLNFDDVFINILDKDDSGRILCSEVRKAIRWTLELLKDRGGASTGTEELKLSSINTEHPEGSLIQTAATKMLRQLRQSDAKSISLDQVRRIKERLEAQPVSEAGVTLPHAANDDETRQFVEDIVATLGGVEHPSDEKGVNQEHLDAFLAQAQAYLDWAAKGDAKDQKRDKSLTPLGARSAEAYGLLNELRVKIDQYFAQCRALKFDERTGDHFLVSEGELKNMDLGSPDTIENMMLTAPISVPAKACELSETESANLAYTEKLSAFFKTVVRPAIDKTAKALSHADWEALKQSFEPHRAWVESKPPAAVEALGTEKLQAYLQPKYRESLETLINESRDTAVVMDTIRLTEKLILFQANLLTLLNNFVSFPHLYDPISSAMFEMGTLIMDGRRFTFSVKVHDRARHSELARTSGMFVIYAEVDAKEDATGFEVAVPVTAGGKGNLCVGKRGIFEDVRGRHFDARIVQIIANPISLREALVSPYQRFGRLISGKIESITAASEKKFDEQAKRALDQPSQAAPPVQAGASPMASLPAGGLLMGGGVAIAALSSAAAYVTKTIASVHPWKLVITILCAALAVMLPTAIVAILKLRRRDLSAILEGSGWAINARMRLTFKQAHVFTCRPLLPGITPQDDKDWRFWSLCTVVAIEVIFLIVYIAVR